jgi:hypothetical protein
MADLSKCSAHTVPGAMCISSILTDSLKKTATINYKKPDFVFKKDGLSSETELEFKVTMSDDSAQMVNRVNSSLYHHRLLNLKIFINIHSKPVVPTVPSNLKYQP